MLYPQMNEKRYVTSLDGLWDFVLGDKTLNLEYLIKPFCDCEKIYVPASYNDQKADINFRDHYGYAYYQKKFSLPLMQDKRLVLRFGAVTHSCIVYLNGKEICQHKGGFLPFEVELNQNDLGISNLLAIAVDNRINFSTLPVGNESKRAMFGDSLPNFDSVKKTEIKDKNYPNFDFFNFCGINRTVHLYTTSKNYIDDITITTSQYDDKADVTVAANIVGDKAATVTILDKNGNVVAKDKALDTKITIDSPVLWQPGNAYLYTAKVEIDDDCYYQKFGIREIKVDGNKFLINGQPFYFKGFGKHEDSEVHGRGIDQALNVKDLSLMKWINANSFRTSHYPYSEEMLSLCDEEGIVVIAETPAVGLNFPNANDDWYKNHCNTKEHHENVIRDMINRDKNHPSIVMWSLANEPDSSTSNDSAYDYFMPLYDLAHECDPQNRPVTLVVCNNDYIRDRIAVAMDVICLNRYYGWYIFAGDMDAAVQSMDVEMQYFSQFNKPLMITEYGADAVAGVHNAVPNMFSEEFQMEYYKQINAVLDKYDFVVGEQAWNFADFATIQGVMRVDGNKKGIFTRDRRPKLSAHYFKHRWQQIPNFNYKS